MTPKSVHLFIALLGSAYSNDQTNLKDDIEIKLKSTSSSSIECSLYWPLTSPVAGGRSRFLIDRRYPEGRDGETPRIILQRDKHVNFSCSSIDDFNSCQWKGPFSDLRPCQIYGR